MDKPASHPEATSGSAAEPRIGSYRILRPLGSGGMSSVYHGAHVDTGHEVALKVLTRTLAKNPSLLQRFLREAKSALTLEHPNIVAIYDRGMDQGRHYLVLEYVVGGDYHDHVRREGPLSPEEAVATIKSVAGGLKYAAGRGLIHRDIKPSNLLRTSSGHVKIIDLGLALHYENEDERVTREGTTVGTVDYMAPEQARDSRATSIQSDIYSLGCTFYYLLTGVAPFPGGDVTDKLTRHATAPPPDVRDLRPEVPESLSIVLRRMMAKQPRDRFASYDELFEALDQAVKVAGSGSRPGSSPGLTTFGESAGGASRRLNQSVEPILEAEIVDDDDEDSDEGWGLDDVGEGGGFPLEDEELALAGGGLEPRTRRTGSESLGRWIAGSAGIAGALMVLLFGLAQLRQMGAGGKLAAARTGPLVQTPVDEAPVIHVPEPVAPRPERRDRVAAKVTSRPIEVSWREPADVEESITKDDTAESDAGFKRLPEWARGVIPARIPGPWVEVQRITGASDVSAVASLHAALDRYLGGTIELGDEGPFPLDDFRVSGETRLIRAKAGRRAIIRIEGPTLEVARELPAVCVLDRKSLILDGLDLIVVVRDLTPRQRALFQCVSSDLTLRNCTVTIVNPAGAAFAFVRAESTPARPSRVRLERTLVRGNLEPAFELVGGGEVAIHESAVLAGLGPVVRVVGSDASRERRLSFVESLLASQGPMVEIRRNEGRVPSALGVLAYETTFGRWLGAGIASVVTSPDSVLPPGKQMNWAGERNSFQGWKGYFASGPDATVSVENLAAARSTWSALETESREIPTSWPRPRELSVASLADLAPFAGFADRLARRIARPRAGLFEKTLAVYDPPLVPELVARATAVGLVPGGGFSSRRAKSGLPTALVKRGQGQFGAVTEPAGDDSELVFDVSAAPWNGDLGRFLTDRIVAGVPLARVRVVGSGEFRSTPVRLPRGLVLEIKVDAPPGAVGPSWAPAANATGPALIELTEGLLFLSGVALRHADDENVEHLIRVEDGHLALWRCRLLASGARVGPGGDLVAFRAASTRPIGGVFNPPLFERPLDRPTCRMVECVLITGGTAIAAEMGRGLVALSDCAVATGATSIDLIPTRVARNRFHADLWLSRCTLASEQAIVRAHAWPGLDPGPDRPWLISSGQCAFLSPFDRRPREGVLLRADADSIAKGAFFWQENDDAIEVDCFAAAGDSTMPAGRTRDLNTQWIAIWGKSHVSRLTGPRGAGGSSPSARLSERLHPGQVAPEDLILDAATHPGRAKLTVGADLVRQGFAQKTARGGRRRN